MAGRNSLPTGRKVLNRVLYNACRSAVDPQHRANSDLVRVKRAAMCKAVTAQTRGESRATPRYEELTIAELNAAIRAAQDESNQEAVAPATPKALAYLRHAAMTVALRYMDFSGIVVEHEEKKYAAEAARVLFESLWRIGKLPKPWYARVRREYVNPRWNHLLHVGGFRGKARYESTMYDDKLTADEVKYLTENMLPVVQHSQPVPLAVSAN